MHFNKLNPVAIANFELYKYLESQAQVVAPQLKPLVPANIKIERIGFTRNASNTPYIVYQVNNRRWSRFIKRVEFMQLVQVLLKLVKGIDDKIRSLVSTPDFGLLAQVGEQREYIPSSYVRKFFDLYNRAAVERIAPTQDCSCSRKSFCQHDIVSAIAAGKVTSAQFPSPYQSCRSSEFR